MSRCVTGRCLTISTSKGAMIAVWRCEISHCSAHPGSYMRGTACGRRKWQTERVAMGAEGPTASIIGLSFMDGKYIGDEGRNKGKQFCRHFNRAQTAFPSAKRTLVLRHSTPRFDAEGHWLSQVPQPLRR